MRVGVSCVVEVDIRKFFDTLDHAHLRTFLQQRIRDGVVLRRIVKRKTASSRFTRAIRTISPWCRSHRHDPMAEQHATLCQKLRGHAAYYGITGNSPALSRFRYEALRVWRKWLMRRRRAWRASWTWFGQLLTRYPVPYLHAVHSVCRGVANG
ncbi:MAG: hypothetical protein NUV77_15395 [Thermoguttaceae bacterium]|nr:hypothetical protein [Thermoguttaceae bacterium]